MLALWWILKLTCRLIAKAGMGDFNCRARARLWCETGCGGWQTSGHSSRGYNQILHEKIFARI